MNITFEYESGSVIINDTVIPVDPRPITEDKILEFYNSNSISLESARKEMIGINKELNKNPKSFDDDERAELRTIVSAINKYIQSLN